MKKDFWSLSKFIDNNMKETTEGMKEEAEYAKKNLNRFVKFEMTKGAWQVSLILTLTLLIIIFLADDNDIRIACYIMLAVWIGMFTYKMWFQISMDHIYNLKKKKVFLNNEFEYLINSVVEVEGIPPAFYEKKKEKWKYEVTDIIINRPRKIKKDVWEVLISLNKIGFHLGYGHHRNENILNISDQELEEIISNKKELNSFLNLDSCFRDVTILNPEVFKNSN